MLVPRETPLEAAIVESQTRDGRSGVQGHRIAIHADRHNETAFMERKKSFVESKAMDGRGRVDDRPIHARAQPLQRNSEQGCE
jgi:hypothetical protein